MTTTNFPYTVYLNYPSRTNDNEKGITIDFRRDVIRSCRTKTEAIELARQQQLREMDFVYVEYRPEKEATDYHLGSYTVFHRSLKEERMH